VVVHDGVERRRRRRDHEPGKFLISFGIGRGRPFAEKRSSLMRALTFCACAAIAAVVGCATAQADDANTMPNDRPVDVNGVNLACTGVGDEAKTDPRWAEYAVKIEFANRNAEYLTDVDTTVADAKGEQLFQVRCESPWLLADLPLGKYTL